jgi:hypothetical protein
MLDAVVEDVRIYDEISHIGLHMFGDAAQAGFVCQQSHNVSDTQGESFRRCWIHCLQLAKDRNEFAGGFPVQRAFMTRS